MLFRSRFAWSQFILSLFWVAMSFLWFREHPHKGIGRFYLLIGVLQLILAAYSIASYRFSYWLIEDSGLIRRNFWRTRTIPWSEITHVGPWTSGDKPSYNWLAVDYVRPAPLSNRGQLLIQPADRDGLVRALRLHAPQADFEFFPAEI